MQKFIKFVIGIVGSLILLAIIAVIGIAVFINPNHFKPEISNAFHDATGKYLVLNGEIHWSFFPWVALQLNNVQISDTQNTTKSALVNIQRVEIETKLLPLLKGKLSIDALAIDRLTVNLSGNTYDIRELKFKSQTIKFNQPITFDTQFVLQSVKPKLTTDIEINGDITLNSKQLANPTLRGKLQSKQLQLEKLTINDLSTPFTVQNKVIKLSSIHAKLYQGNYTGNLVIDLRGNAPKIINDSNISKVQAEQLMLAMAGVTKLQVSGLANVSTHFSMQGDNANALLKTLNGTGNFALINGILKGVDVRYWTNTAQALAHKEVPSQSNTKQTNFGNLTGSVLMTNGVVSNKDLLIQTSDARATGQGTANLITQQLNYQLTLQRVKNGELKDAPIPLIISGSFSNPNLRINVQNILEQQLKGQIKVKVGEQLQKSLGDELGKKLNNLLH